MRLFSAMLFNNRDLPTEVWLSEPVLCSEILSAVEQLIAIKRREF